jgi:5-methylcytosine-specific restriction endonuclease McrA
MSVLLIRSKKSKMMDEKIDLFCLRSAELLESIHTRCNNAAGPMTSGTPKKKRKRRQRKNSI